MRPSERARENVCERARENKCARSHRVGGRQRQGEKERTREHGAREAGRKEEGRERETERETERDLGQFVGGHKRFTICAHLRETHPKTLTTPAQKRWGEVP